MSLAILAVVIALLAPPSDQADTSRYVPADLDDAIAEAECLLPPSDLDLFRSTPEREAIADAHFAIGMFMRNEWGLWAGSRLSEYFNAAGLFHPDDISSVVLKALWRKQNHLAFDLRAEIRYYQQYWRECGDPPDPVCSTCGVPISVSVVLTQPAEREGEPDGCIHLGTCSNGHHWAYRFGHGWYPPQPGLLEHLRAPRP